jgi:hypothetical protein
MIERSSAHVSHARWWFTLVRDFERRTKMIKDMQKDLEYIYRKLKCAPRPSLLALILSGN